MADRFDEILDDCLSRIGLRGETVESCLTRYPEQAAKLEPYLRTAVTLSRTYAFTPSAAAKDRARQGLQAEQVRIRQKVVEKKQSDAAWRWWSFGWFPRWATAAVATVLVVLIGGVTTVTASSNAMPGDLLYPVKRSAEQARLALQVSPDDKARLALTYAERRAEEMVALIREGKEPQLAQLQQDMQRKLDTAANAAASVADVEEAAGLKSQFQQSATETLASLQAALQEAPQESRQTAADTFQASSQALGRAVESVTSRAPAPVVVAAPGVLQLLATDPPPPGVEKVLVTVGQIDVHLSAGDSSRWITVTQEPQTFDLLRVADIQKFLGQQQVEPGWYTKVRFNIIKTIVVARGVEHEAKVPGDSISLVRPFTVESGKTTAVLLDFDGSRSLHLTGQSDFMLKPVVNVLVHKHGEREKADDKRGPGRDKDDGKRGRGPGVERQARAEFEGRLESVASDHIVVMGVRILITPATRIDGRLEVGQKTEVEAVVQPDGAFVATKVEAKGERRGREEEKGDRGRKAEVEGALATVSAGEWVVGNVRVKVTPETEIRGQAVPGATVKVEGFAQADGSVLATEIRVAEAEKPKEKEAEEKGKGKEEQPRALARVKIEGQIEKASPSEITIGGKVIVVGADTKVEGAPVVGASAEVEGEQQADGKVLAKSVKVLKQESGPGGDRDRDGDKDKDGEKGKASSEGEKPRDTDGKDERGKSGVSFTGTIEKLAPGEWTVEGKVVVIGPQTKVEGTPSLGLKAEVDGQQQADGKVVATSIKVAARAEERGKDKDEGKGQGPQEKDKPQEKRGEEGRTPGVGAQTVSGTIQKVSAAELTIDGKAIIIERATRINGTLAVGTRAQVVAQPRSDGKLVATTITVQGRASGGAAGKTGEKEDEDKGDSENNLLVFTGPIASASPTQLTVDGRVVIIGPRTEVEGLPKVGLKARVKGRQQPDGRIIASSVEIMGASTP